MFVVFYQLQCLKPTQPRSYQANRELQQQVNSRNYPTPPHPTTDNQYKHERLATTMNSSRC